VDYVLQGTSVGDQYAAEYGVDVMPWTYVVTTNAEGFRPNSAGPPYEIVLVGDSFLTAGEEDASTLSERLRAVSGRATFNLSRSWYGPYQYVELLKRYGLALRPQVALLGFYAGSDIEDIREYHAGAASTAIISMRITRSGLFSGAMPSRLPTQAPICGRPSRSGWRARPSRWRRGDPSPARRHPGRRAGGADGVRRLEP